MIEKKVGGQNYYILEKSTKLGYVSGTDFNVDGTDDNGG